MGDKIFPSEGLGPFKGMSSPLNAKVSKGDPQAGVAQNYAMPVDMPNDPLGVIPGSE